jgi:DNA polymerase II large subunit
MQEQDALDFYERVTQGTTQKKIISLEHRSGATLEGVEVHPVDKRTLASVISRLPEEMFDAVEEADTAAEAEENMEEEANLSLSAVTEDTVDAFEDLCLNSLNHPDMPKPHMESVIRNLNFEMLFNLGTEVIDMSAESDGAVMDFHEQR